MKDKTFFCDYSPTKEYQYVDTSGMTKIECSDCDHYSGRVRSSGSAPLLSWLIEKINDLFSSKQ